MKDILFRGIQKALDDGLELRAFGSGGGLRVVRIEDPSTPNRDLKGYGEHPNLREACLLAHADYLAGRGTAETHYLTGSSRPEDNLDSWILRGHRLTAKKLDGQVLFEAKTWDYKSTIKSVSAPNFGTAYSLLSNAITEREFETANR